MGSKRVPIQGWGSFGCHFGSLFGAIPFGSYLGPIWGPGAFWGFMIWGPFGSHLGSLLFGAHWAHLGFIFYLFGAHWGLFWAHFIWGPFGPYFGPRCYPLLGVLLVFFNRAYLVAHYLGQVWIPCRGPLASTHFDCLAAVVCNALCAEGATVAATVVPIGSYVR